MTPKFTRLLMVAAVAAGFGILPMPGARADSAVVVADMPTGFSQQPGVQGQCKSASDAGQMPPALRIDIHPGDTVTFYVSQDNQKTHNVVPATDVAGSAKWPVGKSPDLHVGDDPYPVTFKDPGVYWYYSNIDGEGSDTKGKLSGMCGVIRVGDTATTTSTTPPDTAPPATQPTPTPTTAPPATTGTTAPASAGPAATHPATPASPTPTTTAPPKPEKDHKGKEDSTTTTAAPPVNGPTDLPAEAIVPSLPSGATVSQDGAVQPSGAPTGDAIAVIKHKHGHGPVILLVVSGLGIGALGVGVGVYKWANRSSQYFPA